MSALFLNTPAFLQVVLSALSLHLFVFGAGALLDVWLRVRNCDRAPSDQEHDADGKASKNAQDHCEVSFEQLADRKITHPSLHQRDGQRWWLVVHPLLTSRTRTSAGL